MKAADISWKEILAFTAAGVALWIIAKPSGDKAEDKANSAADKLALSKKSQAAFSETFYVKLLKQEGYSKVDNYLIKIGETISMISNYCQSIYDSKGLFNDNEESLYSVFRIMKNLTVCSIVAKSFKAKFGVDMYSYLSDFLSSKEMTRLIEIINTKNYL